MQSNTNKAAEVISESVAIGINIHAMDGELEMNLDDYNASKTASIEFDYDDPVMANIEISGDTSEVSMWVSAEDAHALSDVFADLAKDIEQRSE